jgi:hypothetical protein
MKKCRWLTASMILALTVVVLAAVPALAQGRGNGQWGQGGQGYGCGQGQGQGYGPGYANCPNNQDNQGYQNCRGTGGNNTQAYSGRRGMRGGGRAYQPSTQPTPPANNQ